MTQVISNSDRDTYLRAHRQGLRLYLAAYTPDAVLKCSLSTTPTSWPTFEITVGSITVGSVSAALAGYTLEIWDSTGTTQKSWLRLRKGGSGSTLYIAEIGQGNIDLQSGDKLKVYPQERPVALFHAYNPSTQVWDVDKDVTYTDQNENYGPFARIGGPVIGFRDAAGNCDLKFVGENSVAYTPNDAILAGSGYSWTFPESQSSTSQGTEASPIVKTFTQGHSKGELFSLTVTENTSGKTHTRKGVMWTFDRDGSDAPMRVAVAGAESDMGQGGMAEVILYGTIPTTTLRKGAYVCLFAEQNCGGTIVDNVGGASPYRSNVILAGYVVEEAAHLTGKSGENEYTRIVIATPDEPMRQLSAYPVTLENTGAASPTKWEEAKGLNVNYGFAHWYKWRAQIPHDCYPARGYGLANATKYLDLPDGKLWEQLEYLFPQTIMGIIGCSMDGSLRADSWYQTLPDSKRWAGAVKFSIEEDKDCGAGALSITENVYDESAQETVSCVHSSMPFYSRLPDDPKGYMGIIADQPPGLALSSQTDLNRVTGRLRAWKNRNPREITLPLGYFVNIDANPQTIINVTIPTANHPRSDDSFSAGRDCLVTRVNHTFYDDPPMGQTTLTVEPVITDDMEGIAFTVPEGAETPPGGYLPPPNENPFIEVPSIGEFWPSPKDAYTGTAIVGTDAGTFITTALGNALNGLDVPWFARNVVLDDSLSYREIVLYASGENTTGALIIGEDTTGAGGGAIYRKENAWDATSHWEEVYTESNYETAIGGSLSYNSGDTCYFRNLRILGSTIYLKTRHVVSSTIKTYVLRTTDAGDNWTVGANAIESVTSGSAVAEGFNVCVQTGALYAGANVSGNAWLRKSDDDGDIWANVYDNGAIGTYNITNINVPLGSVPGSGAGDWTETLNFAIDDGGFVVRSSGQYITATYWQTTVCQTNRQCIGIRLTFAPTRLTNINVKGNASQAGSGGNRAVKRDGSAVDMPQSAGALDFNDTRDSVCSQITLSFDTNVAGAAINTLTSVTFDGAGYSPFDTGLVVWLTDISGAVKRSINGGSTFSVVSMPGGWGGYATANGGLHSYTSDADYITVLSSTGVFAVSANGTETTPTFTVKASPGTLARIGGWPTDFNWFSVSDESSLKVSDDGGATWYEALGNLTDYGVTKVYDFIARSIG